MKLFTTAIMFAVISAPVAAAESTDADFINNAGEKIGKATIAEMAGGTVITLDLKLPEGTHAMHLHENGKCDAPDFKSAGGHYNPAQHKHGIASNHKFHAGDLPNLYVEPTGHIKIEIFSPSIQLSGKNALSHGAIIIHENADDYSSAPSGNAGGRIACAVIKP